jgi:hypothetical protein
MGHEILLEHIGKTNADKHGRNQATLLAEEGRTKRDSAALASMMSALAV